MAMEIFKELFEEKIIEIKMSRDSFETVGNWPSRKMIYPYHEPPCPVPPLFLVN